MATVCSRCDLPLKAGDCLVICESGCGSVLHGACATPPAKVGARTVLCGFCEPTNDDAATLRTRLVELQWNFTNLKLMLLKLQRRDTQTGEAQSDVSVTVASASSGAAHSTPVAPAVGGSRAQRCAKRAKASATAAGDAAAAKANIRERPLLEQGKKPPAPGQLSRSYAAVTQEGAAVGVPTITVDGGEPRERVGSVALSVIAPATARTAATAGGALKRDREAAELSASFNSAMDTSVEEPSNRCTAERQLPAAAAAAETAGAAGAAVPASTNNEETTVRDDRTTDQPTGQRGDGFTTVARKRKQRPKLKCGSSEAAKTSGLEFAPLRTVRPRFYGIFVDGLSKSTSAAQLLNWYVGRGVKPYMVWKLKRKGQVSAFCISLNRRDLHGCLADEFYPKQMMFRRWGGGPPTDSELESASGRN